MVNRRERGAAVAEFVLVSALLAVVFAGVLQLSFALHIRNTVTDSALAGARKAALVGSSAQEAEDLTRQLITTAVGPSYAEAIAISTATEAGIDIVTVEVTTPIPLVGSLGPQGFWTISADTVREDTEGLRD